MAQTVFKCKNSFLSIYQIENSKIIKLIDKCIETIYESKNLIHESEILIDEKICHRQRNVCNFSDVIDEYPNSDIKSLPLTKSFKKLLKYINESHIFSDKDFEYNSILINEYVGGEHYIGRHSDKETYLGGEPTVIGISVGESRKFRIRKIGFDYDENGKKHIPPILFEHETGNYEIMLMGGSFQMEFTHEIPQQKKLKGTRISFTFRKL
jgi:alpha-ketoglutarate-dependent dioxygenase alkB family protein 2